MRKTMFVKGVALLLVLSMGWLASGCFGKFQLTRKLYEVNQSVDEKYVRSVVTWLFIIPYGFTAFLDFVVFNVIEFWSGQNPIAAGPVTKVYASGDEKMVMTLAREDGATVATIEKHKNGALVSTLRIRDDGNGAVASSFDAAGGETIRTTATRQADGSMEVVTLSPAGKEREMYAASTVETYLARASRVAAEVRLALTGAAGAGTLASPSRLPAFQG